jgi:hypothetical protein
MQLNPPLYQGSLNYLALGLDRPTLGVLRPTFPFTVSLPSNADSQLIVQSGPELVWNDHQAKTRIFPFVVILYKALSIESIRCENLRYHSDFFANSGIGFMKYFGEMEEGEFERTILTRDIMEQIVVIR